ncbi:hypothetical protein LzC2_42310 [Planctomycetes bacterium LzC2]|uniref:Uncharacterized protein n=1 Tax=Alienimonas chondri TaxID=2681879 RepID=A0ABX1VJ60_9PLAN|nr:hypothetical protein [Alienimonas chondri]
MRRDRPVRVSFESGEQPIGQIRPPRRPGLGRQSSEHGRGDELRFRPQHRRRRAVFLAPQRRHAGGGGPRPGHLRPQSQHRRGLGVAGSPGDHRQGLRRSAGVAGESAGVRQQYGARGEPLGAADRQGEVRRGLRQAFPHRLVGREFRPQHAQFCEGEAGSLGEVGQLLGGQRLGVSGTTADEVLLAFVQHVAEGVEPQVGGAEGGDGGGGLPGGRSQFGEGVAAQQEGVRGVDQRRGEVGPHGREFRVF